MIWDTLSSQLGMVLVQLVGLVGLCLGRLSLSSKHGWLLQAGYFACLLFVASVLFFFWIGIISHWWLVTGTTFALMVVGTMWESPPSNARGHVYHELYPTFGPHD